MSLAYCLILLATCVFAQLRQPPKLTPSLRSAVQDAAARLPTRAPKPSAQPTPPRTVNVDLGPTLPPGMVNSNGLNPPPSGPTHQPTSDATSRPSAPPTLQPTARFVDLPTRQPGPDRAVVRDEKPPSDKAPSGRPWLNTPPTSPTLKPPVQLRPTAPPTRAAANEPNNAGGNQPPIGTSPNAPSALPTRAAVPTPFVIVRETEPTVEPTGSPTSTRIGQINPAGVTDEPTSQPTKPAVGGGQMNLNGVDQPTVAPTPLVPLGSPTATIPPTFQAVGIPDPHAPTTPPPINNLTSEMTEPTPGLNNQPQPGGGGDTLVPVGGAGQTQPTTGAPSSPSGGLPSLESPPEPSDKAGGVDNGGVRNPVPVANSVPGGSSGNGGISNEPLARPRSPVAITLRQGGRNGIFRTPEIKTDGTVTTNQLDAEDEPSAEPTDDAELQNQRRLSGGAIAGVVIGALVGVAALAAIAALAINAIASSPPSAPTSFSDEEVYYQLV